MARSLSLIIGRFEPFLALTLLSPLKSTTTISPCSFTLQDNLSARREVDQKYRWLVQAFG